MLALSDRLNQDPFLGATVHTILTHVWRPSARPPRFWRASPISTRGGASRFVSIIASDSRRLSDVAQTLAGLFDQAHTVRRPITPVRSRSTISWQCTTTIFQALETVADALRSATGLDADAGERALVEYLAESACGARRHARGPRRRSGRDAQSGAVRPAVDDAAALPDVAAIPTRRFQLARLACELGMPDADRAAIGDSAASLGSPAARQRAERALSSYLAGALLMPYGAFREAACRRALRHRPAVSTRFGVSFEQVCHRLVTLRRPGAEGIRLGFMRVDPAGRVTKRFPLPRLPLQRYGSACPLWAVYEAFRSPGTTVRQLAEFPGGERYLLVARTVEQERPDFRLPRHFRSVMLACDALHADRMVYGDGLDLRSTAPATPVGPSCRVCARRDCLLPRGRPDHRCRTAGIDSLAIDAVQRKSCEPGWRGPWVCAC